jgi:WD40 repeat protein/tetratricopeptide (TPR) repeat protein
VAVLTSLAAAGLVAAAAGAGLSAHRAAELAQSESTRATVETQARARAEQDADEVRKIVGQQYAENGTRLLVEGDVSGALLWYVEALQRDGHDAQRAEKHRLRVGSLLAACPPPAHVWFHGGKVTAIDYTPDEELAVTASEDGTARIWDVKTGTPLTAPLVHPAPVRHARFSRDGRRVLTLSGPALPRTSPFDRNFPVWRAHVWDKASGKELFAAVNHRPTSLDDPSYGSAFSPDGKYLLTRPDEKTVRLWDATTGEARVTLSDVGLSSALFFSPGGGRLIAFSVSASGFGEKIPPPVKNGNGKMHYPPGIATSWDLTHPFPVPRIETTRAHGLHHATRSPDGRYVLLSGTHLELWDLLGGESRVIDEGTDVGPEGRPPPHFSSDGRYVLFRNSGGKWQVAEVPSGRKLPATVDAPLRSRPGRLSPDGSLALVPTANGAVSLWHVSQNHLGMNLFREGAGLTAAGRFSPDGRRLAAVEGEQVVRVYDAATWRLLLSPLHHAAPVHEAEFSPHGRLLHTLSGNEVRLWVMGPAVLGRTFQPEGPVFGAWLTPDGRHLVMTHHNSQETAEPGKSVLSLWEVATGKRVPLPPTEGQIRFSPDGRRLLTWQVKYARRGPSTQTEFLLWEIPGGARVAQLKLEGRASFLQFSPDARHLLFWDAEQGLGLWEPATGTLRRLGPGSQYSFSFTKDGRRVVAVPWGGPNQWIRVWDTESGKLLGELFRPATKNPAPAPGELEKIPPPAMPGSDAERVLSYDGAGRRFLTVRAAENRAQPRIWDLETGKSLPLSPGTERLDFRAELAGIFSPDGRFVVLYSPTRLVYIRGQPPGEALGPAGGQIAHIWDAATGNLHGVPLRHSRPIQTVTFSPDGRRLLTASTDGTARLWDVLTCKPLTLPLQHPGAVSAAAFGASDGLLHTLSHRLPGPMWPGNQEWWLWDAETAQPLLPPFLIPPDHFILGQPSFRADLRGLLLLNHHGGIDLVAPVADRREVGELVLRIQVLSGRHIVPPGNLLPFEGEAFRKAWESLRSKSPGEFARPVPDLRTWHTQELQASAWLGGGYGGYDDWRHPSQALWHLDRLLALEPHQGRWWNLRARVLVRLGRPLDAVASFDQAIACDEKTVSWHERGELCMQLGDWKEAAKSFRHAARAATPSPQTWPALALLSLQEGDRKGYAEACARSWALRHQLAGAYGGVNALARILVAGEANVTDLPALLESLAPPGPRPPGIVPPPDVNTGLRAAVHYRAGRYEKAASLLETTLQNVGSPPPDAQGLSDPTNSIMDFPSDLFFLAMAQHRLGRREAARQAFARGADWLRRERLQRAQATSQYGEVGWQRSLRQALLRREAEAELREKR